MNHVSKLDSWRCGNVSLSYWDIGGEVYRCNTDEPGLDSTGAPLGARWESTRAHYDRYRDSAYAWLDGKPEVSP